MTDINTPVSKDVLDRLGALQEQRYRLAEMLLDIKQEEVKLLVQARTVDNERTELFNKINTERGIAVDQAIEIDANTGIVTVK